MAAERHPNSKYPRRDLLTEILDFGEDTQETPDSPDLGERIRKVKEKIAEINQRIQRLNER